MNSEKFNEYFLKSYHYEPTKDQRWAIYVLSRFIFTQKPRPLFVLKGYAGTGKTSIVSTLVKLLPKIGQKAVLMAPTGRAAKVLGNYSGQKAYTIHKRIYFMQMGADGSTHLSLQSNKFRNAIFVVDEASMIHDNTGNEGGFSGRSLLDDLFQYVYSGDNCKLILIGDHAQLPPVGSEDSPALNMDWLRKSFNLTAGMSEMREVVRQARSSGILMNATSLRRKLELDHPVPPFFHLDDYKDITQLPGYDMQEWMETAFNSSDSEGNAVMITRSNKRANRFNQEIRNRILFRESKIDAGDRLMVVKNNYFWLGDNKESNFIANGDMIEVLSLNGFDMAHGFNFANATIRMMDYPGMEPFDVMLMLDTLDSESPALTREQQNNLYNAFMQDLSYLDSRQKRLETLRKNPLFNALQVKFGYALTCHKTQGGQWKYVFVDQGYLTEDKVDSNYLRWLYTAITRATEKLMLVNFKDEFFEDKA
ncbi:MAG: ATP-dependent DNA helicase [Bacteroidales bacterium]